MREADKVVSLQCFLPQLSMKNNQSGYQPLSFEKDRLQTAAIFMSQR